MSKELIVAESGLVDFEDPRAVDILIKTVAIGLTKEEFGLFAQYCQSTKLNPFKKEVWAIKAGGRLQIMTGIAGYWTIANSHPQFDGAETGMIDKNGEWVKSVAGNDFIGAWCKVYRKDRKIPMEGEAMLTDYKKSGPLWEKTPRIMLKKVAQSIALRQAFSQELNGTYTAEEMPNDYALEAAEPTAERAMAAVVAAAPSLKIADDLEAQKPMSAQHDPEQRLGFGKHRDLKWSEVNQNYLEWLVSKQDSRFAPRALAEIDRRKEDQSMPDVWGGDDIPSWEEGRAE